MRLFFALKVALCIVTLSFALDSRELDGKANGPSSGLEKEAPGAVEMRSPDSKGHGEADVAETVGEADGPSAAVSVGSEVKSLTDSTPQAVQVTASTEIIKQAVESPPAKLGALRLYRIGARCEAKWSNDGEWYSALVTGLSLIPNIGENRAECDTKPPSEPTVVYKVSFDCDGTEQECEPAALRPRSDGVAPPAHANGTLCLLNLNGKPRHGVIVGFEKQIYSVAVTDAGAQTGTVLHRLANDLEFFTQRA